MDQGATSYEVDLGPGDVVLDGDPAPPPPNRGRTLPNFCPCLLCQNGWMDQDPTWYGGRPRPRPHSARWGPSSPPQKGAEPHPQFLAHVCCGQTAGWIKMPLSMEVGLSPAHIVLHGDQLFPQKGHSPQFLAHICCGQMTTWIKMPLGTKIGLGPGHIVLYGCLLYTSPSPRD